MATLFQLLYMLQTLQPVYIFCILLPFENDVLPCSSIFSRFNIGGWCWSDKRVNAKFVSVSICQLLFTSEQLHGPA